MICCVCFAAYIYICVLFCLVVRRARGGRCVFVCVFYFCLCLCLLCVFYMFLCVCMVCSFGLSCGVRVVLVIMV